VAADRLREAMWRTLMRVCSAVGDYDGVVSTFAQCQRALRAAEIAPAAAIRALLHQLRR
jgi:DNA-binding SARP family transcriptional activator